MHQNFHFQGIFSLRSLIDSTVGWMRERYKIQPDQDLWSERQCHLLAENRAQSPSFKTSGLSIWLLEANKDGLITFSLPIMGRPYQKQVQESPVLQTSEKLTQKFIPSINWHLFSTPDVPGNFFSWVSLLQMRVYPLFRGLWKDSTVHFKGLRRWHPRGQPAHGNFPVCFVIVQYSGKYTGWRDRRVGC